MTEPQVFAKCAWRLIPLLVITAATMLVLSRTIAPRAAPIPRPGT